MGKIHALYIAGVWFRSCYR